LWGYWFCTASIPVYETSRQVRVSDKELTRKAFSSTGGGARRAQSLKNKKIFADFSAKAIKNIERHQQGYFFPEDGSNKQSGAVSVTVSEVVPVPSDKSGQNEQGGQVVLLAEYPADRADPFAGRTAGKICIAVGQTTPMKILARTSGLLKPERLPVAYHSQRTAP
ncbi:MAG: hypothetical protein WBM35_14820, partial [Candidatus Electrothrix sp.]